MTGNELCWQGDVPWPLFVDCVAPPRVDSPHSSQICGIITKMTTTTVVMMPGCLLTTGTTTPTLCCSSATVSNISVCAVCHNYYYYCATFAQMDANGTFAAAQSRSSKMKSCCCLDFLKCQHFWDTLIVINPIRVCHLLLHLLSSGISMMHSGQIQIFNRMNKVG
jgi:hypothetical protein